jgi:hypothetical protein
MGGQGNVKGNNVDLPKQTGSMEKLTEKPLGSPDVTR